MGTKNILTNFIGGSRKSDKNIVNMSYTQNMYYEKCGDGATSSFILRSISGMTKFLDIDGTPRARYVSGRGYDGNPRLFVVYDSKLYCIDLVDDEYVKTYIGEVEPDGIISMCETGGEGAKHPQIVVADGESVHIVEEDCDSQTISSTYRTLTLPIGYKGEVIKPTFCTYEFNFLTVNDSNTGYFYRSYQYPFETEKEDGTIDYDVFTNDPLVEETYPNGMYIAADFSTDTINGMCSTNGNLYVFGQKSMQVFSYSSDSSMPFNCPLSNSNHIGLLASGSLCSLGSQIFWLGGNDIGQYGIYTASGNNPTLISNNDIERQISEFKNPQDAISQCWTENGHQFYALTFIEDNHTFVYDTTTSTWHDRVTTDTKTNTNKCWRYKYAFLWNNKLCHMTKDALVYVDSSKHTEHDGNIIIRLRRGGATIDGMTPFCVDNVKFIINNGYVSLDKPLVNPKVMFRWSGDGTKFSNERLGYMGKAGAYNYVTQFPRLGMATILNMELSCSEDIDFIILACVIQAVSISRWG